MAITTWNPADKNAVIALSGGDLTATSSAGAGSVNAAVRATQPISGTVKTYFEVTVTGTVGQYLSIGVMNDSASLSNNVGAVNGAAIVNNLSGGTKTYINGTQAGVAFSIFASGQVVRVAVDRAANKIWWAVNNNIWSGSSVWFGDGTTNADPATGVGGASISVVTGTLMPAMSSAWTGDVAVFNGGAAGFAYAAPSGFTGMDTGSASTWSTTDKSASLTLTGSNLIATAGAANQGVRGAHPKRTGKYYIEYTTGTINAGSSFGLATARTPLGSTAYVASFTVNTTGTNLPYDAFGNLLYGGTQSPAPGSSALVCIAIDLDNGRIWYRIGAANNWNNGATNNPATGAGGLPLSGTGLGQGIDAYPFVYLSASANSVTANFGATAFTGAVPAGFTSGWDDSVSIVTNMVASQALVEHWGSGTPDMQATIVLIEHWASVADAAPVTPSSDTRVMVLA